MQKELKDSLFQQYFAQEPQTSPYRQIPLLPDKLTRNLYCQLQRSALGQAALEASCSSEDTSRESSFFHATSKHSIQILWVITLKCQSSHILQRNSLVLVEGCQACGISLSKGLNPSWQFALKSCCLNKRESRRTKMYDTKCTQPPTSTKLFGLYCCICLLDIWFLQFQQLLKNLLRTAATICYVLMYIPLRLRWHFFLVILKVGWRAQSLKRKSKRVSTFECQQKAIESKGCWMHPLFFAWVSLRKEKLLILDIASMHQCLQHIFSCIPCIHNTGEVNDLEKQGILHWKPC